MKYYGKIQDYKDLVTKEYVEQRINDGPKIYGFHINSAESDPAATVTYLKDAVGATPAYMDYSNNTFVWGSWGDTFFIPRPCMLKYDGTVDYYLDPNDYSKKEDGTASDVADDTYGGNAMMEWGQNGKKIWYKIVPDSGDDTSASVYIADERIDTGYHAWSFINNQGVMVDHFYTPIYNGSIDTNGKLRSISGKGYASFCKEKTAPQEVAAAKLNNPAGKDLWYTEVYADVVIINLLLILISKTLDSQTAFGNGKCASSVSTDKIPTGALNDKGLFFGYNDNDHGVKVFGMENWWGNQNRRYAGDMLIYYNHRYKLTRGTQDGSSSSDYVHTDTNTDYAGYLTGITAQPYAGFIKKMKFTTWNDMEMYQAGDGGTLSTYYCDYCYLANGVQYVVRGGSSGGMVGYNGALNVNYYQKSSSTATHIGASVSCKPMAQT